MTRRIRCVMILGASLPAACSTLGSRPPAELGWTREELQPLSEQCTSSKCSYTIDRDVPGVEIHTQVERLRPHQIPGWEVSTAGRVLDWLIQDAIRGAGGISDQTVIGIGSRKVVEAHADGWQARCSIFWMDDETVERVDGADEITGTTRRTEGIHCDAIHKADTTRVRWRLRSGIAPGRDRVAAMYDSLVAGKSDLVGRYPPTVIEEVDSEGVVTALLRVKRDSREGWFPGLQPRSRTITRSDNSPVARLHEGMKPMFDYAPGATEEERQIVRLFGAAMALPLR